MDGRLTTTDYWETIWENRRLPIIAKPYPDMHRVLNALLPQGEDLRLLEIGCAPGGWMVYFHRQFGYVVSGIEYAANAARIAQRNLQIQCVPASIISRDFFDFNASSDAYDIVFSGGFLEHFAELDCVTKRICSLSAQYVVTLIPNLCGLGGLTMKAFSPTLYRMHTTIDVPLLRTLHEEVGMRTLFCDYVGGVVINEPAGENSFLSKRVQLSRTINFPFKVFNSISRRLNDRLNVAPRTRLLSPGVLYVGRKGE